MYRDDFKDRKYLPRGKWEYDKKTRIKNWFYYYKWWLLAGTAGVVFLVYLVCTMLGVGVVKPDYSFAVVMKGQLPDDTVKELEEALTAIGDDLNGDGTVKVDIVQFTTETGASPDTDAQYLMANSVKLQANLVAAESHFFILDDPDWFQETFSVLAKDSGEYAGEEVKSAEGLAIPWDECETLRNLPLSDLSGKIMSNFSIGRRGYPDTSKISYYDEYEIFWRLLTHAAG